MSDIETKTETDEASNNSTQSVEDMLFVLSMQLKLALDYQHTTSSIDRIKNSLEKLVNEPMDKGQMIAGLQGAANECKSYLKKD